MSKPRKWRGKRLAEVAAAIAANVGTMADIEIAYGVTSSVLHSLIRREGWTQPRPTGRPIGCSPTVGTVVARVVGRRIRLRTIMLQAVEVRG